MIEVWYDQRIEAGTEWDDTIKQKLEEAEIILFLVSTDLLASKYVRDVELPMALEQYQAKRSRLLPVIVRACNVKHTPLGKLQALPNGGRPLKGRRDRDEACMEVENGIRAAVEDIRRTKPAKRL